MSPLRTPAFSTRPIGTSQPGLVLHACSALPPGGCVTLVPQAGADLTPHWGLSDLWGRRLWYLLL